MARPPGVAVAEAAAELADVGNVAAEACGAKQKAAAPIASAGAAAAVAPCGSRMRDGLLWRPKGLLSELFALSRRRDPHYVRAALPPSA
jgi:hypothetical protein